MEMLMMVAMFMWTMGPKTKREDKVFAKLVTLVGIWEI